MANFDDLIKQFDYQTEPFDIASQKREQEDYLSGLTEKIGGLETIPAMASRIENQLGIPQLRQTTQRLGEMGEDVLSGLYDLPESVKQRSMESLVTEGGRQRMIAAESQPMQENLRDITRALGKLEPALSSRQEQLGQRMGYEMAQQEREMTPWLKEYDLMTITQAREFSDYQFQEQLELDKLIAKGNLTNEELNRANQLAIKELEFKNNLDRISTQGSQDRETKKAPTDLATLYRSIFG